jgi:hypothetical protein
MGISVTQQCGFEQTSIFSTQSLKNKIYLPSATKPLYIFDNNHFKALQTPVADGGR